MENSTVNKAILIGTIARVPRLDSVPNGTTVCNATIVTISKSGKQQFTDIVLWDKLGELFSQMAFQGSRVYIEGQINTYTDKSVQKTEITVTDFVVLDRIESNTARVIEDSLKFKGVKYE